LDVRLVLLIEVEHAIVRAEGQMACCVKESTGGP
jgi:hypothetical protein